MYEVECKLRVEHGPVLDRLERLGADHLGLVTQVDTYFDAPDRSFAETDEALRLRHETDTADERTVLTYKGPLVDDTSKTRRESETSVENADALRAILEGLGYEPAATVRKTRDRYSLDTCTVTLDTVADLGEFVEVEYEAGVSESRLAEARDTVHGVLSRLSLDPEAAIRRSYLELLLDSP
jgi:adenylate cyclase class 2